MPAIALSQKKEAKDKELYFYGNLADLMAEKGLAIAQLSELSGVAQSTIRSLIRGRLKRLDSVGTGIGGSL